MYDDFFITTFPSKVHWIGHEEDRKVFHTVSASSSWRRFSSSFASQWMKLLSLCWWSLPKHASPWKVSGETKTQNYQVFFCVYTWAPLNHLTPKESLNLFLFSESCPVLSFTLSRNLQSFADHYVNNRAVLSHEVHNTSDEKTSEFSRFAYTRFELPAFCDLANISFPSAWEKCADESCRFCCACSFPLPSICFIVSSPLACDVGHP